MFGMSGWEIVIIAIASFRMTRLIVFDKITEFFRAPFFDEVIEHDNDGNEETYVIPKSSGWRKWFGELLSCYWCTGVWVSAFLVLLNFYYEAIAAPVIVILAVAGIASIIETIISFIVGE